MNSMNFVLNLATLENLEEVGLKINKYMFRKETGVSIK